MSKCCSVNANKGIAPVVMACPLNGARSKRVDVLTVKSLVRTLPLGMSSDQYYFCEAPDCDVVYFTFARQASTFRREDLLVRVSVKEKADTVPVCYCFGFTRKNIQDEIAATGHSTIADRITVEVKAGNCACEVKNPSGKCCLGNVARVVQDCVSVP
ncbi:MAG: copper chaperone Copz family protein [Candidatus Acidiferrum sp.]